MRVAAVEGGLRLLSTEIFLARLTEIFREELDQNHIVVGMATTSADVEAWDSLAHVRIVAALEREFGIEFDVSEIETIDSVRGFYDAVSRRRG